MFHYRYSHNTHVIWKYHKAGNECLMSSLLINQTKLKCCEFTTTSVENTGLGGDMLPLEPSLISLFSHLLEGGVQYMLVVGRHLRGQRTE